MIVISWLQLALVVLVSIAMGLKSGLVAVVLITALLGAFAYLFVWGFTRNSLGLIAFTWYVKSKIFPDFAFITPKKIKGTYVFSN